MMVFITITLHVKKHYNTLDEQLKWILSLYVVSQQNETMIAHHRKDISNSILYTYTVYNYIKET